MATEQFANNYASTLTAGLTNSAPTLAVASATGAPTSGNFRILIDSEIIVVGAVSGTTFSSLQRGAEGTTAATHSSGATVTHVFTAGALAAIQRGFNGLIQYTQPPSSGWSWDNQGISTIDSTDGYEYASFKKINAVGVRARHRTASSTPYTISAALLHDLSGLPNGNGLGGGYFLGFRENSSGKLSTLLMQNATDAAWYASVTHWATSGDTGPTHAFLYGPAPTIAEVAVRQPAWLQISDDGTNLLYRFSIDGLHWKQVYQESRTAFMSGAPDQVCWGAYANGDDVELALLSWEES